MMAKAEGCPNQEAEDSRSARAGRRFFGGSMLVGLLALAWLLLRSGTRPSRLAYPCQRAAVSTVAVALGAPLAAATVVSRRALTAAFRAHWRVAVVAGVAVAGLGAVGYLIGVDAAEVPPLAPSRDYRAQLFHVAGCPEAPVGDRFPGLDGLVGLMGQRGLKIYRSAIVSPLSGPEGIVAAEDVVLVKINYQWPERGGTNTDLLRGLIRVIVDHPDGFTGEVVVCENTQFADPQNFDRQYNNAQDPGLSPRDVVNHFAGLGYGISLTSWRDIRFLAVSEYSDGDMSDGYVVYPNDPLLNGRISYPKFQTAGGAFVSLRDGLWDLVGGTYDRERLKVINLPVLKSHGAVYGGTASVKHDMGVVTRELGTNSHGAIENGLLGAVMAEVRPPDLNILDAIWVSSSPSGGPWCAYGEATRRDELVASVDPVAADIWSVTYILVPTFLGNGYTPPWPEPDITPDDPGSDFRVYLDSSMSWLLADGYQVTNDLESIDVVSLDLSSVLFVDGFESGDFAEWSSVAP